MLTAEAPTWRWLVFVVAVGLVAGLLRSDALTVGLIGDDYIQHAMLAGIYPGEGYAPFDLYAFLRNEPTLHQRYVELGAVPWWSVLHGDPGAEQGTVVFAVLRPLSSALLALDHAVVPIAGAKAVFVWHLHSLLWFVAAVAAVGMALRRMFAPSIAAVGVVLFALDPALVVPLAWLANRCALICACFGALALWAHVGWRSGSGGESPRRLIVVEVVCICLALAGGEYGVVAACYVLGWELVGLRDDGLRKRALAILPVAIPVLLYLCVHQLAGYGTFGEGYVDVFDAPGDWLRWSAQRLFKLVTGACWSVPTGTSPGDENTSWLMARAALSQTTRAYFFVFAQFLTAMLLALWLASAGLSKQERRALGGLILGGLIGMLPLTAAPSQARLLIITELGASALIAAILVGTARLLLGRSDEPRSWPRRLAPLPFAIALLYSHTFLDLRAGQQALDDVFELEHSNLAAFSKGDLLTGTPDDLQGSDVVVVNSLNLAIGLHGSYLLDANGWPTPRSWRTLAMGSHAMTATRLAPDLLELRTIQAAWLTTPYEFTFRRSDQLMHPGEVIERPGLRIEIVEAPDGRPTRVLFRFESDLDDPRYRFVTMTAEGLKRWTPPVMHEQKIVPRPRLPKLEPGERINLRRP